MFFNNLDSVMKQFNKAVAGLEQLETQNNERAGKLDSMISDLSVQRTALTAENSKIADIKSSITTLLK
jgi:ABC-type transporter Mla subunit MlaD